LTHGGFFYREKKPPRRGSFKEVINMEIMKELINEKKKEAVMDDDDCDPSDIADNAYKEWLESHFMKEWENGRQK
jgi:hypothetical protein